MKKLIGCITLAVLLLVGCGKPTVSETQKESAQRFDSIGKDIDIITDSKTGCKYIYIDSGMGNSRVIAITPLMKTDIKVDCGQ